MMSQPPRLLRNQVWFCVSAIALSKPSHETATDESQCHCRNTAGVQTAVTESCTQCARPRCVNCQVEVALCANEKSILSPKSVETRSHEGLQEQEEARHKTALTHTCQYGNLSGGDDNYALEFASNEELLHDQRYLRGPSCELFPELTTELHGVHHGLQDPHPGPAVRVEALLASTSGTGLPVFGTCSSNEALDCIDSFENTTIEAQGRDPLTLDVDAALLEEPTSNGAAKHFDDSLFFFEGPFSEEALPSPFSCQPGAPFDTSAAFSPEVSGLSSPGGDCARQLLGIIDEDQGFQYLRPDQSGYPSIQGLEYNQSPSTQRAHSAMSPRKTDQGSRHIKTQGNQGNLGAIPSLHETRKKHRPSVTPVHNSSAVEYTSASRKRRRNDNYVTRTVSRKSDSSIPSLTLSSANSCCHSSPAALSPQGPDASHAVPRYLKGQQHSLFPEQESLSPTPALCGDPQQSCRAAEIVISDDEDGTSDHESRGVRTQKPQSGQEALACPFYKWNPAKFTGCAPRSFQDIRSVSQHLKNDHYQGQKPFQVSKKRGTHTTKWFTTWKLIFGDLAPPQSPCADRLGVVDQFAQHLIRNVVSQMGPTVSSAEVCEAIMNALSQWKSMPQEPMDHSQLRRR
jgi:hypothetical protein